MLYVEMHKGVALGLVLLGAGGAWVGTRLASGEERPGIAGGAFAPENAPDRNQDTEISELRHRLAQLEQAERARRQAAGETLRADTEARAEDEARKSRLEKLRRIPAAELEAKMFARYFASLDEKRHAEGVDAIWAGDMNALLSRGVGSVGAALDVRTVDCGRTLCRVELTSANEDSKEGAINELLRKIGPELPQASVHVTPGSNRVTAYLARAGTDLPNMESPERLVADLP
ncbi:MAG TPA: hypothetical protein VGG33_13825 [Polyangia bacterium]